MKNSQLLALMLLVTGYRMHAALPKEEHWLGYNNPFDRQILEDNDQIQFHGDSFQQAINQLDENGDTFLHRAARLNTGRVRQLIEFGADVNLQDKLGDTPLHLAVNKDYHSMIELLIELSADVNRQNNSCCSLS